MESNNFSLKSFDWTSLLKEETSEDSGDSDETFIDGIDNKSNENHSQPSDRNPTQYKGEINHKPMVHNIPDTLGSNQNTPPRLNEEQNPNLSHQIMQYNLEKELFVNEEPQFKNCYNNLSVKYVDTTPVNNFIKAASSDNKHRFESDFGFTEMSCTKEMDSLNVTLDTRDFCNNKSTLHSGCENNETVEFGLDSYLIIKPNDDQRTSLESPLKMSLKPQEICQPNENILELVTSRANSPFEGESIEELQSAILQDVEEGGFLNGLTPTLNQIMEKSYFDSFIGCQEVSRKCSPPLTLSKGVRRKVLPADKVLPNYKKKNWQAGKKLLPNRNCSSAYIDLSNRKCEGGKSTETITDIEDYDTFCDTTDSAAQDDKAQPNKRRGNSKKFQGEIIKSKCNEEVKEYRPIKVKRRRKKKQGVYRRKKIETTSETAPQEREPKKEDYNTLQEVKTGLEYLERRIIHWVSGADVNPPTREQAFEMLAETQSYFATLQQLKNKNGTKRKCIQEHELQLINFLLERSRHLDIAIDKAIAEADRLMNLELSEISEGFQTTGKENSNSGMIKKENKYLKPILKNSSSEPSTEDGGNSKRSISFSEEVDCRYLSCSGQSSSISPSQSVYEQHAEHSSSSDTIERNFRRKCDKKLCYNIDFGNSPSITSLTSNMNHLQKSKPIETLAHPDFETSFQNLSIVPTSNGLIRLQSNVPKSFEKANSNCFVENACRIDALPVNSSKTESTFLVRDIEKNENQNNKNENLLHPISSVDKTNCVQNNCNKSEYSRESLFTQNDFSTSSLSVNCNSDPVFDNNKNPLNQTKDLLRSEKTTLPSSKNDEKHKSFVEKFTETDIKMDKNQSLPSDQNQLSICKSAFQQSDTSFNTDSLTYPLASYPLTGNVNDMTAETDGNLVVSDNSAQPSEHFGFSEQNIQPEDEWWNNFSILNIKSVRIPDPSEFTPWNPLDSPDDWADLEDW